MCKKQDFTDKLNKYRERQLKLARIIDAKQNEYDLTKSLVDNLEGFPESIKFLKKNYTLERNFSLARRL